MTNLEGLRQFVAGVVAGSAREIAAIGDASSAMLLLTVEADFGGQMVTLPAARLYLLDGEDKIKAEQVILFALS